MQAGPNARRHYLGAFAANNLYVTRAFYTHPKILVTALNGPAIGLSAALIAHSDFIYTTPDAYLLTPFASVGLVTEGASSAAFVRRLGAAKANEALLMGKKITAAEMLRTGFANGTLEGGDGFTDRVVATLEDAFSSELNDASLLQMKALIRAGDEDVMDRQNVREVLAGLERFVDGIPQAEFGKISRREKKHKL